MTLYRAAVVDTPGAERAAVEAAILAGSPLTARRLQELRRRRDAPRRAEPPSDSRAARNPTPFGNAPASITCGMEYSGSSITP